MAMANYSDAAEAMAMAMLAVKTKHELTVRMASQLTDNGVPIDDQLEYLGSLKGEGDLIRRALAMFWRNDVAELVLSVASQVDRNTRISRDLLYCQAAWCFFEKPIDIGFSPKLKNDPQMLMHAISWSWGLAYAGGTRLYSNDLTEIELEAGGDEGLFVTIWKQVSVGMGYLPSVTMFVKQDDKLSAVATGFISGEPLGREQHTKLSAFAIAAGAFLRTKLPQIESTPIERHVRKRIERSGIDAGSSVDVVMLRKRETGICESNTSQTFREWQHQWIVGAHIRQQWYASKGLHLPIVIAPYFKGPQDKPIKAPPAKVFAVTR